MVTEKFREKSALGASVVAVVSLLFTLGLSITACNGGGSGGSGGSGTTGGGTGGNGGTGNGGNGGTSGGIQYVNISGGTTGFQNPMDVAVDGAGNVWVTNNQGSSNPSSPQYNQSSLTELTKASGFSAAGALNVTGTSGELINSRMVAVDPSGNLWVTSRTSGDVVEFTKSSGYSANAAIAISGFDSPVGIAADSAGNIWVVDWGFRTLSELPYSAISAAGATAASIAAHSTSIGLGNSSWPTMVTVDPSGNVWVACLGSIFIQNGSVPGSIVELPAASNYSPSSLVNITGWDGQNVVPFDIAADASGNIWITGATLTTSGDVDTPVVSELTKASNFSPSSALNITGWNWSTTSGSTTQLTAPLGIALDGGGNVWLTVGQLSENSATKQVTGGGYVTELTKAGGYSFASAVNYSNSSAGFDIPAGIAIDGAGNVWVTNSGIWVSITTTAPVDQSASVTELVQAAVPVTTPLL